MNQFIKSTAEKLSVLTRQTEPFSPSKCSSQPMCNSSNYHPLSPRNLFPPTLPVTPIIGLLSPPPMSSQSASLNPPLQACHLLILSLQPKLSHQMGAKFIHLPLDFHGQLLVVSSRLSGVWSWPLQTRVQSRPTPQVQVSRPARG